jgi:hypothetical protein
LGLDGPPPFPNAPGGRERSRRTGAREFHRELDQYDCLERERWLLKGSKRVLSDLALPAGATAQFVVNDKSFEPSLNIDLEAILIEYLPQWYPGGAVPLIFKTYINVEALYA